MPRYTSDSWSIQLASGWHASENSEFVVIDCSDAVGSLQLAPAASALIDAASWVDTVAKIARVRGRACVNVTCGDFDGNLTEFEAGDEWLRGWALRAGDCPLDATYRCSIFEAGRDDSIIDAMLRSLRQVSGKGPG